MPEDESLNQLIPVNSMTRAEFIAKARNLLDAMEEDHEGHTGVSDSETMDWEEWSTELTNAYLNE